MKWATGIVFWIVLALATASSVAGEGARRFSARDLPDLDRVSNLQVSPDGRQAAFELRTTDLAANRLRAAVWIMQADGSGPRCLTPLEEGGGHNPAWAPDGRSIYFLSARSGSSQVWRVSPDGGRAEQITDLPLDVGNLKVSPDGVHVAFSMEVFVGCESLPCTVDRIEKRDARPSSGVLYSSLFVRHWDTWSDGRRTTFL